MLKNNKMIKVFIISMILLAIAVLLMGVRIFFNKLLFNKQGKFPISSVGHNPEMKKLGISCVKHDELSCYSKTKKGIKSSSTGCSCG